MSNLNHNNFHDYRLLINKDEYWDLYLSKDKASYPFDASGIYEKCLTSYISFDDGECIGDNGWIYGKSGYTWESSVAKGKTLENIGFCGTDNGLILFRKDRITNKDFTNIYQDTKLEMTEGDVRLKLHTVSGNTLLYEYPISVEDGVSKLNGGFYQGFFKTKCDEYQVLPSSFNEGEIMHLEFTMNRCDLEKESDKTVNDKYPQNKGIFFYLGTRAENKFVYLYDEKDEDGLEKCLELGLDDFVEDGEIDKKSYIIGNFGDVNPEFVPTPSRFQLGDYTDYEYDLFEDMSDGDSLSDYLSFDEEEKKPYKVTYIDSCGCEGEEEEYTLVPFFRGCSCPISYKRVKKEKKDVMDDFIFGDNYISDLDGFDCEYDYLEDELDISDFDYYTDNGLLMSEANQYYFYTDNKFLMFDRTKDGMTVNKWVDGTKYMYSGRRSQFKGNLFVYMNRTKTGYTVSTIDSLIDENANEYNPYVSIYDNAFALRVTDEGAIGYRLLTKDCEKDGRDKTSVMEGYSNDGVIPSCEWFTVNVRIEFYGKTMRLKFYVDGKLVYITRELPKIRLRKLNDLDEKQEGVPFNISLGGGTQGLAETILPNYMLNPTRVYPIERNFCGSFIGYIKSFRLYLCGMEQREIENNFFLDVR